MSEFQLNGILLDPSTTAQYLRARGELDSNEAVRVVELAGGVSNQVLLVERGRGDRFVLKQAREQLRVKDEWKCDVRRIWREIDVLRLCSKVLASNPVVANGMTATVPEIFFEDRDNFCYAMTDAPEGHRTWKEQLLGGDVALPRAALVGRMLGTLHAKTWHDSSLAALLGDRSYFEALRIDPYYRYVAARETTFREPLEELIEATNATQLCFVHGDYSPKNLLVSPLQLMLIDFEVGHYGDPAFDTGFCLSHLLIKGIATGRRERFQQLAQHLWDEYCQMVQQVIPGDDWRALNLRTTLHLAGCLIARVAGKSQVDYLSESQRQQVSLLSQQLFNDRPADVSHAAAYLVDGQN